MLKASNKLGQALVAIVVLVGVMCVSSGAALAANPDYPAYSNDPTASYGEPPAGQVVSDVKVITGNNPYITCPDGYTKRYPDLNTGLGVQINGKITDYVYTCLRFAPAADLNGPNPGIGELYVSSPITANCNGDDQQVAGDLNSGMDRFDVIPDEVLFYCIHRPGDNGGSGIIPHPGDGYSSFFPTPATKLLRDVQFMYWSPPSLPACFTTDCVATSPIGAFAYLEAAKTYDPYCQHYFGPSYHPLFQPWQYDSFSGDFGTTVPKDSNAFDLNAGVLGKTMIFACGSYVNPDTTPPTITASATTADGQPYPAGTWTNQNVTVHFDCTDETGGSGVDHVSGPTTASDETTGQTITGSCSDKAGNVSNASFGPIQIDKTPPAIVPSATTADGQFYDPGTWTNQDVTVSFRCVDGRSGVVTDSLGAPQTVSGEVGDGQATSSGDCVDRAGNRTDAPLSYGPIQIDKTKPVITGSATTADGQPYAAGAWTNQNVTVSFRCTDGLSGVASDTVGGGATFSAEGANQSATSTGGCTDQAGNTADSPITFGSVKIDRTKPIITATATTADGQPYTTGTWTGQNVTVPFRCADPNGAAPSGVGSDTTSAVTVQSEGADQSVTNPGGCTDNAGNGADPVTLQHIKIDKTAPRIDIAAPSGTAYLLGQSVPANYACADPLADGSTPGSGVRSCAGPADSGKAIDTTAVGSRTFTVNATDKVGNASSKSVSYQVSYKICGLDPSDKINHAGSTIPVKLDLCDATGHSVSSSGIAVTAQSFIAADGSSQPSQDAGNANPGNAFRYAGGRYIYNLNTKGLAAGAYKLSFTAAGDPVVHDLRFQLG
jgi:hypothetical protein